MTSLKLLSFDQYFKALAIIPKVASVPSLLGSGYILRHVLGDPKRKRRVQGRLLCGLTVCDIISSTCSFLSTWPIPADSAGPVWGASGNDATCSAQGFLVQLTVAGSCYNAGLALYYFLAVVHGWSEDRCKKLEPYLHAFAWVYGLTTAIVGLALGAYHNATLWCHFGPPFEYEKEMRLGLYYSIGK